MRLGLGLYMAISYITYIRTVISISNRSLHSSAHLWYTSTGRVIVVVVVVGSIISSSGISIYPGYARRTRNVRVFNQKINILRNPVIVRSGSDSIG